MSDGIILTGGCQCGAVRYRIAGAPLMAYACHCTNCQRLTTSAFGLSTIVPEAAMTIEQGDLGRLNWTADSGRARFGEFCTACGARIRHGDDPSRGVFVVRSGTLDDTRWGRPAAYGWTRSAVAWMRFAEDDLLFDQQPDDYPAIAARYRAQLIADGLINA